MIDKEMLDAMRQMMQEEIGSALDDKLEPIKKEQAAMREEQAAMREEQAAMRKEQATMQKDIQSIKHEIKEMAFKIDVVYDWVDGIDLKVKSLESRSVI